MDTGCDSKASSKPRIFINIPQMTYGSILSPSYRTRILPEYEHISTDWISGILVSSFRIFSICVVPLIENKESTQIENIRNELTRIPDIKSVEICSNSGSILVQYDAESIEPYIICGILIKVLGLEDALGTHPESIVQKEIRMVANAINQTFYNSTAGTLDLTSAIMILIISFGLYKILIQKDRSLPGGITMLWWAYVMAKGRNQ